MAGTGKCKTSPAQLAVEEKQVRALNMRMAGASFSEIAEAEGYASPSGAYEAVKAALEKARSEPAEELRQMELARLDEMQASIWEVALSGSPDAVNSILRIMAHRARLTGLERKEAPLRIAIPKVSSVNDALRAISALIEKAAAGEILPGEALQLATLLGHYCRTTESTELSEQLAELRELAQANYEKEKAHAEKVTVHIYSAFYSVRSDCTSVFSA